tara:strand:+ start:259 stop:552 length:294 start_codon:yes stop_codon:yes gene_type:complete
MVNKNKILSDLSKIAVDAMSAFSGLKEEIETMVSLRVDKVIKKMNLVKKDEFDVLKKMVQKLIIDNENLKKTSKVKKSAPKRRIKKAVSKKKDKKRA